MWIAAICVAARSSSSTARACGTPAHGTGPANRHATKDSATRRARGLAPAHPRLDIEAPLERQLVSLHRDFESAKTAAGLGWNFDRVAPPRPRRLDATAQPSPQTCR